MEGGPQNPQQNNEAERLEETLLHIAAIPLGEKERNLVSTLISTKRLGTLTIALNKNQVKMIDILPHQSTLEKAENISSAFNTLYTVLEELRKTNPDEVEEYEVTFADANLH